ncbi:hypothetical protein [Levilactobacillus angrenensis]|uniref:Uncharacterized protein n=1 Tax=Levilactobacillus angrenensis TaxID=2486020 RepID=A0ABW1UBV8_9LACO|nr:hypothetical protein [Levilactobacillus angrenensis]
MGWAYYQLHKHVASLLIIHWLATYAYRAYLANVFGYNLSGQLANAT